MTSTKLQKELLLSLIFLTISALLLWQSYSFDPESRQFPVFLSWIILALSAFGALQHLKHLPKLKLSFKRPSVWPLSLVVLLSVGLYAAGIYFFSYYLATFVFLFGLMSAFSRAGLRGSWRYALIAGLFIACIFVLFTLILGTRVPEGELFTLLGA